MPFGEPYFYFMLIRIISFELHNTLIFKTKDFVTGSAKTLHVCMQNLTYFRALKSNNFHIIWCNNAEISLSVQKSSSFILVQRNQKLAELLGSKIS